MSDDSFAVCDLYQHKLVNEKVDVWALGTLLFTICYNQLAFDGAPLAILNGNYSIPQSPQYPPGCAPQQARTQS